MHGDFLNGTYSSLPPPLLSYIPLARPHTLPLAGWDQSILQSAIETCDTPSSSGEIEDCKVLELYNRSVEGTCRKTPDVNEIVLGSLKSLPGCNPRTNTMADALAGIKSCPDLKAPEVFATPSVFTGNVAPPGELSKA